MGALRQDLRYALRMLWKRPGGTIVIICTLGLVLGGLSLALGMIQHERSAWLPFPDADHLVRLWRIRKHGPLPRFPASVYAELSQRVQGMGPIAATGGRPSYILTDHGEPRSLSGQLVSASVFEVAGIQPMLGRTFSPEEERTGEARLVVLSYQTWQKVFDCAESIIGDSICLNEEPHTVVGVMPKGYERNVLFYGIDIWLPGNFESPAKNESLVQIVGRVKSDGSLPQLRAELDIVVPPIVKNYAASHNRPDSFGDVSAFSLDKRFGRIDTGAVAFVTVIPLCILLVACFNIANILLARMTARRKEMAVRSALGAGRPRLICQLLTESVLLALGGGLFGLLGATWISGWAATRGLPTQFSSVVLGGVLAITFAIGLAVGWFPAWRATHGDLVKDLKERSGCASGGIERHRLRSFLVAGQVAMATVLCISAGLLVQTYLNKKRFDPGFETKNLLSVAVYLSSPYYETPDRRLLYCEQALERISTVTGVEEVGVCSASVVDRSQRVFPMGFQLRSDGDRWQRGQMVNLSIVSPNYLKMVNVPLLQGRPFTDKDRRGSALVALVNQSFVRQFFAQTDPIGRQFRLPVEQQGQWFTIVGVVPDRRNLGIREDLGPEAYLPHRQVAPRWGGYFFLARTKAAPGLFADAVRQAVRSVDNNQPVSNPFTVQSSLEKVRDRDVEGTQAMVAIGSFGLIMAVLGIYGVVSNSVAERTHELGVRMALGACQGDILRLIVKQGMKLALLGLAVGVVLAFGTTFAMSQLLFGASTWEPAVYISVGLILSGTALVASLLPAQRATKVDPMVALKYE
ncbi:MAG: ABC transporter permease [Phycisphaerales bacterium]|nr:MAG: ABC transporter permease [Phycisphaerales bacterium]